MFDWLGDIISGIGSAIGDTIDFIGSGVGDAIWNAMLKWLYEIIYGAIADFFEMIFHHAAFYVALTVVNAFKVHCVDLFVFVYFYMQAA